MAGAGTVVTVACKLPHGFDLRVFSMEDYQEPILGGGWKSVKRAVEVGQRHLLAGVSAPFGLAPVAQMAAGYALTHNVDADFFAKWLDQNADSDVVKNRLIFAAPKALDVEARAKENEKTRSGLEPLVPGDDVRISKRVATATGRPTN